MMMLLLLVMMLLLLPHTLPFAVRGRFGVAPRHIVFRHSVEAVFAGPARIRQRRQHTCAVAVGVLDLVLDAVLAQLGGFDGGEAYRLADVVALVTQQKRTDAGRAQVAPTEAFPVAGVDLGVCVHALHPLYIAYQDLAVAVRVSEMRERLRDLHIHLALFRMIPRVGADGADVVVVLAELSLDQALTTAHRPARPVHQLQDEGGHERDLARGFVLVELLCPLVSVHLRFDVVVVQHALCVLVLGKFAHKRLHLVLVLHSSPVRHTERTF
mmetsp:Transcript_49798/g.97643  ORF Transcript_49798/g.97643 Transcript_49798/m.97643 type:complete len:269 (-) Transcript_49798:259-1065(-)